MGIITGLILLAFVLAGFYGLLRFLFPKSGENSIATIVLSGLALLIGLQSFWAAVVICVVVAVAQGKIAAFLKDCGLTRERVETIGRGLTKK